MLDVQAETQLGMVLRWTMHVGVYANIGHTCIACRWVGWLGGCGCMCDMDLQ